MPITNENGESLFTQEELNSIIGQRLAKFADYDQLKAELETVKSNLESDKESAITDAVNAKVAELNQNWGQKFVALKAQAVAASEGYQDPEDASRFTDLSAVGFDTETGEVDEDAIVAQVREAAEKRPYLLKRRNPSDPRDVGLGTFGQGNAADGSSAFASMDLSF